MKNSQLLITLVLTTIAYILFLTITFFDNNIFNIIDNDNSALFLSLIPFMIYLVVSGKIKEIGGGSFAIKFKDEYENKVKYTEQEIEYDILDVFDKLMIENLPMIVNYCIDNPNAIMRLRIPGLGYTLSALNKYLKSLLNIETFKYVVFVNQEDKFVAYTYAINLLTYIEKGDQGCQFISELNNGNLKELPGLRRTFIQNVVSNNQALRMMEQKRLQEIAIVNIENEFLGITNKNIIILGIVKGILENSSK